MTLIILPVKNESKTVEQTALTLVEWCNNNMKDFHILFIDDRSKDGTIEKIEGLNNPKVRVLKNQFDNGKGSTLKVGFVFSNLIYKMKDDDHIIFMDGDGQIGPENITALLNHMTLNTADVAIGNKRHIYSITDYSFQRNIISICYNLLIKFLFGMKYQDTQCGIKIFKKMALEKIIDRVNVKKYAFDLELIVALRESRFRVADAPVKINQQENLGSVSLDSMWQTFIDTVGVWNKKRMGYYHG